VAQPVAVPVRVEAGAAIVVDAGGSDGAATQYE